MSDNYIIDTSIWIDYFNGNVNNDLKIKIDDFIINNLVYYNGVILSEILSGYKKDNERKKIIKMLSGLNFIDIGYNDYIKIAENNIKLLSSGFKIPFTDLLIFYSAKKNNCILIARDKHFNMIKNVIDFNLIYVKN